MGENFNFSDFLKVFKIEENHHIFMSTQLKYKDSLICRKNVHMYELSKKCRQVCGGRRLQVFSIFEKFSKLKKNHHIFTSKRLKYFHLNTTKTQKIPHLEEKCARFFFFFFFFFLFIF